MKLATSLFHIAWLCASSAMAGDAYRIRFIDSNTLKPIASHPFQLVPRRFVDKGLSEDAPDPNLQFAKPFSTDAEGFVSLPVKVLVDLTGGAKIYIDSHSDTYARFCISGQETPPAPLNFSLTTFRGASGEVVARYLLSTTELTIIVLERIPK